MKKFIVETYYTCTFKTVHTLDELNDKELANLFDNFVILYFLFWILLKVSRDGIDVIKLIGIFSNEAREIAISLAL